MADPEIPLVRAPLRALTGIAIESVGSYVPDRVVTNSDLASLGCDPEWIVRRTGIRERRYAPPEMATSDLATIAGRRCLQKSNLDPQEIDLVVVGTFTADATMPSTACLVQNQLGLRAAAMDVQAACAGFFYALVTGMQFVATGCSRAALVVGADCNSRVVNPSDVKTYPLFGDGAGAVLLVRGTERQGLLSYTLGADGSGYDLLYCPMGGARMPTTAEGASKGLHFIKMEGKPVFKWAVRMLVASIGDVLNQTGLTVGDVDLFVLHQANIRILDAAAQELGIDPAKLVVNLDRYGNTSSGSIPLALDECVADGRIRPGNHIVMSGFGGGLAWGTGLLRW
jgi:3-oxoacyl-[acyl-carrier-protein] synthase III